MLITGEVDAYVADNRFRKRDPHFVDADRYKEHQRQELAKLTGRQGLFSTDDFVFAKDLSCCLCPAGKRLNRSGDIVELPGFLATKFKGLKSACTPCQFRSQCLHHLKRLTFGRRSISMAGRSMVRKPSPKR